MELRQPQGQVEAPQSQVTDGTYHVLVDYQTRLRRDGRTQYRHLAAVALSETGVESLATIQVAFDPSYQKLVLHETPNCWAEVTND